MVFLVLPTGTLYGGGTASYPPADRARQETKAEIIDFVRPNADWSFDDTVKPSEVVDDIRGWF